MTILTSIADFVWGPAMMLLIVGTGIFLMIGLRGMPVTRIPEAFKLLLSPASRGRAPGEGEISPFGALMSALAATVGVGNIAGVATAIHLGGPGALFWMWIAAVSGMATKYTETFLAVTYRERAGAQFLGGPMYYIKLGLGPRWMWLAYIFAACGSLAALGVGSGVQANAIADVLHNEFGMSAIVTAAILVSATFAVLVGGLRRISSVAEIVVPFMIIAYIAAGLLVLAMHLSAIPQALTLIFRSAFTETAALGGFMGSSMAMAMRFGIARGLFSNEAGLGSAAILHAAAKSNDAVTQGSIGMLGTFIDTLLVNSMTGMVIITTGVWSSNMTAAPLTALGYESALPGFGSFVVTLSLVLFAFTTVLGWSVYGERCAVFLFGNSIVGAYRYLWCLVAGAGAIVHLDIAWLVADILNAFMAIPNIIALLLLSPQVFRLTRQRLTAGIQLGAPLLKDAH